jgi:hypothetical protein
MGAFDGISPGVFAWPRLPNLATGYPTKHESGETCVQHCGRSSSIADVAPVFFGDRLRRTQQILLEPGCHVNRLSEGPDPGSVEYLDYLD